MFRKLCGESTLKNVVLVTNMWGADPHDVSEAREKELSNKFFKLALDKGAQMVRHHNTLQSAHGIIRGIVGNRPLVLQIQRELVDEGKSIIETAAGESVNQELQDQIERHEAEMEELREEMVQALKEKDEETRRELEEERRRLQELVDKITQDLERMAVSYAAEKGMMEARMAEMEREMKWDKAERDRKLASLTVLPGERTRHDTSSTRTRVVEWAKHPKSQLSPTPPRISGPQASSLVPSYVQFTLRPAAHGG